MLAEKYRPQKIDDIVGQEKAKEIVKRALRKKDIPNFLFVGPPGVGKTTMAIAIAKELYGKEWKTYFREFNASDERGINVIREKIKNLSKTAVPNGKFRIIFLDEADAMTPDAQQALRRIMETAVNTRFILSGNFERKIIDPIKSRCTVVYFQKLKPYDIAKRILEIAESEGMKITEESVEAAVTIAEISDGDMRKALNILESILENDEELTKDAVKVFIHPNKSEAILGKALSGDFIGAKDLLEEYIATTDGITACREFYDAVMKAGIDTDKRTKILIRLGEIEGRIVTGANPLIQLTAFIAYVWVLNYLPVGCPYAASDTNS